MRYADMLMYADAQDSTWLVENALKGSAELP